MMRATCQDGQVSQHRAARQKTEMPKVRSGQRARVIFLRDADCIGVERVYTDAEVKFFLSTGPADVASESVSDLTVDGIDGGDRQQEIVSGDADGSEEKHEEAGGCIWDDESKLDDAMIVSSMSASAIALESFNISGMRDVDDSGMNVLVPDDVGVGDAVTDVNDGVDIGHTHVVDSRIDGDTGVDEGVLTEAWARPQTSRPSYVSVVCGGVRPYVRNPVVFAQGAGGVAPTPVCQGLEGLRNGGPCGLSLEGVAGRETCLPRLKGMGNGSFCSDVIQSGLGDKERIACEVLPSWSPVQNEGANRAIILCTAATGMTGQRGGLLLRNTTCAHTAMPAGSPTYSKGTNRTFAVCADATRKGRREGHELLHSNTYGTLGHAKPSRVMARVFKNRRHPIVSQLFFSDSSSFFV